MDKIIYLVKATNKYLLENCYDGGLGRIPTEGETWTVDEERYKLLSEKGYVTLVKKNIPEKRLGGGNINIAVFKCTSANIPAA